VSDAGGTVRPPEPVPVTPAGNGSGQRGPGSSFGWVAGLILIVLGVVFMLQSAGIMVGNWWTIFIFIPALVSFYNSFRAWRKDGRFSAAASGSFTGGLLLTTVGTILALGLDWSKAWPAILIAIGLGLILGSVLGRGKA
jgi:hypothetical protein